MTRHPRTASVALIAISLLLTGSSGAGGAAPGADTDGVGVPSVALVVDSSGTMVTQDVTPDRMTVAKIAARAVVSGTGAAQMGLLTYGTSTGNSDADKAAGCHDVTTVVPVADLSGDQRSALLAGVDGLAASGYTPIGLSLQKAAEAVGGAGSVVLISDGEDTCAPPDPCQVARDLKQQHPQLSISTVGFRTDETARAQLACIANATDGVFLTADDPSQLARRLWFATAATPGTAALTGTGYGGVEIGRTHAEITADHPDFPGRNTARPYSAGFGTDLVVIRWIDCDFIFDEAGTLVAVLPDDVITVDRVGRGAPIGLARSVYGPPVGVEPGDDGTTVAYFRADPVTGTNYRIVLDGPAEDPQSRIQLVILCRCVPEKMEEFTLTGTSVDGFEQGSDFRDVKQALIERFGEPDSIGEVSCERDGLPYGQSNGWGDFKIYSLGQSFGDVRLAGWYVSGPNTPIPVTLAEGTHLGSDKDTVIAETGGSEDDLYQLINSAVSPVRWHYDTTGTIVAASTSWIDCES